MQCRKQPRVKEFVSFENQLSKVIGKLKEFILIPVGRLDKLEHFASKNTKFIIIETHQRSGVAERGHNPQLSLTNQRLGQHPFFSHRFT